LPLSQQSLTAQWIPIVAKEEKVIVAELCGVCAVKRFVSASLQKVRERRRESSSRPLTRFGRLRRILSDLRGCDRPARAIGLFPMARSRAFNTNDHARTLVACDRRTSSSSPTFGLSGVPTSLRKRSVNEDGTSRSSTIGSVGGGQWSVVVGLSWFDPAKEFPKDWSGEDQQYNGHHDREREID